MKTYKVAIINCYKKRDYIRTKVLKDAFSSLDNVSLVMIQNQTTSILRYPEVLLKTIKLRLKNPADVYVLTFRGYELLWPIRYIVGSKRLVFDEFINFVEWVVYEHRILPAGSLPARALAALYNWQLRRVGHILGDTEAHVDYSAHLSGVAKEKYTAIPVSSEELLFNRQPKTVKPKIFTAIYYGSMLPLHGIDTVIDAAIELKSEPIHFMLIGSDKSQDQRIRQAIADGAKITHVSWVPFEELPQQIMESSIGLGGPYGKTVQSQYVVTGKTYQMLSMGLPVLLGDNKAVHQYFTHEKDALLVPEADPHALAAALRWAQANPAALQSIATNGYRLYQNQFSNKVVAKKLQSVITRVVG